MARIARGRDGAVRLKLPRIERALLRSVHAELRGLLEESPSDPDLRRLFPPAYADDQASNAEYERLTRDDLRGSKLEALRVMEETVDADRLSEEQLGAWLGALNDLRLVLGTRLGVTEELDPERLDEMDPQTSAYALYFYLGWLEEQVVQALAQDSDGLGSRRTDP